MFPGSSKAAPGAGFGGFKTSSTALSYLTPPPDFSNIPQEIKAVQDVLTYVQCLSSAGQGLDEAIIDVYVELYPRLSIDDSARVREVSHQLLFHLLNAAKKRMAKKLPAFVGPWLAGTFDRDKRVARAASEALASFLQTKEKEAAFWKAVQTRALEFATEAIKETPDTLSDERSTTKQDSDAKYFRVVGASLALALNLVKRGDLDTLEDGLAHYLKVDAIWTLSKAEDPFVRRAFYQLLQTLLDTKPGLLEARLQTAGKALVADGLKKSQMGSATNLLEALGSLTKHFPQVWGPQKHPLQRLQQFVSQGSQGGAEGYWGALDQLLKALPGPAPSLEVISSFLASMRKGIADRLETRTGRQRAFQSYAGMFEVFLSQKFLSAAFLEENLTALTQQYLHPISESSLPSPQRPHPLAEAWKVVARHPDDESRKAVAGEWQKLDSAYLARMANSLPEVSEGYKKSQTSISSEGERWFSFAAVIQSLSPDGERPGSIQDVVATCSAEVLKGAQELLVRRNFKPFGAASVIQSALRHCPQLCAQTHLLESLFPTDQPEVYGAIVASASLPYLVSDLSTVCSGTERRLEKVWTCLVEAALRLSDRGAALSAVRILIGVPSAAPTARQNQSLEDFLIAAWREYAHGITSPGLKDLCETTLSYDILTDKSMSTVATDIISALDTAETSQAAVVALELVLHKRPELLSANSDLHMQLVTKLLALTEVSNSALSERAKRLRSLLDAHPSELNPIARIIENHLSEAGPASLDVNTLVQQALATITSGAVAAEDIFPSSTGWMDQLSTFLMYTPDPSLSLTSSMGGAYFLVRGTQNTKPTVGRDGNGRSIPARMALFTAKLLSSGVSLSSVPPEFQLELAYLLCLTESLAGDQLSTPEGHGFAPLLWANRLETEADVQEFCDLSSAAVRAIIADCGNWADWDMTGDSLVERLINFMLQESRGAGPAAFYTAKSLSSLFQLLVRIHGGAPTKLEQWISKLGVMRASPATTFMAAAFLTGFGELLFPSRAVVTFCTRLVSEIPGCAIDKPNTLPSLVLFNLCADVYEAGEIPVETRKQVLALQHITRWTESERPIPPQLAAEACKAITRLLFGTKDTYGPYWEQAIEFCLQLWRNAENDHLEDRLPYVYASLKLMRALHAVEDANDDLVEALANHRDEETRQLINLLSAPREDTASAPSQLVDALIAREATRLPNVKLADLELVYESVAADSREIQKAAFGLLHKALPGAQEDINLAVVMDKKAANLPDELLSLLLNAPNPDDYTDEDLAQFPVTIRSYLLAWHLVFDGYSKASFRVRSDYTDNLKSGKHLDPLLRFLVDVLGHALARALDLDREGFTAEHIRSYSIDLADSEPAERDMNWLLIHLFYLILKYIPGLFKMWYLDCPSKQTKMTVQSWMQRFFSPLIISDALDEVVEWAATQDTGDTDTQEVIVKVNKSSHEITAGYPVDDDAATISLHVPKSYPLDPVDVVSVKRVAVKEDKWQSWLKATKAVIMFGNCSLVDGLTAFRRNIALALKDQEECAICYSIIAQDKTLPDKRCGTCNHYFHRVCLYKWFQNSGRNTCPLCRNAIDYLGADTKRRRPEHE
ncbi:hypothetical protein N0V88_007549 [Collariella sp. IMI 366227]|nr:hypothetical protein N0V88_007549 [Collariella sp. IMI 366227]